MLRCCGLISFQDHLTHLISRYLVTNIIPSQFRLIVSNKAAATRSDAVDNVRDYSRACKSRACIRVSFKVSLNTEFKSFVSNFKMADSMEWSLRRVHTQRSSDRRETTMKLTMLLILPSVVADYIPLPRLEREWVVNSRLGSLVL